MIKLAIIGASYLQNPLIIKAKQRGIETHVFAWSANDIGEKTADYFYPISIIEKERILCKCQEIGIHGICSIASDLAIITVNYVAENMGLIGNSKECVEVSTNKYKMRKRFEERNDPSPKSFRIFSISEISKLQFEYPIIVKPVDRSGSRGVTKLNSQDGLEIAIENAINQGFEKCALIEEFAEGDEYSIECISWNGVHMFLTLTRKYTTGEPHFIELAHMEPAKIGDDLLDKIKKIIFHALDSMEIKYGASHSEVKISRDGEVKIIEIAGRMGGDCIGSSLVQLTTGFDFVGAVIDIALGMKPNIKIRKLKYAAIRFVLDMSNIEVLHEIRNNTPEILIEDNVSDSINGKVTDSSTRFGYYLFASDKVEDVLRYLPEK